MNTDKPSGFRLGKWLVEPSLGKLTADGETVSIRPREMDLLVYLAEQQGGIVTADDIITHVWAGVAVTNDSLYFSMSQLRKALDGGAGRVPCGQFAKRDQDSRGNPGTYCGARSQPRATPSSDSVR
jgi:DNA-binding winged helix-turn-helix (wHTH) protein